MLATPTILPFFGGLMALNTVIFPDIPAENITAAMGDLQPGGEALKGLSANEYEKLKHDVLLLQWSLRNATERYVKSMPDGERQKIIQVSRRLTAPAVLSEVISRVDEQISGFAVPVDAAPSGRPAHPQIFTD